MLKVFTLTQTDKNDDTPVYILTDGKFFRTAFHPDGWSDQPDYDLGDDGRIYRTKSHPKGFSKLPDYSFGKDRRLYRTADHPDGKSDAPEFVIQD